MKTLVLLLVSGVSLLFIQCVGFNLNKGTLIQNNVTDTYVESTYGKITYKSLHVLSASEYNDVSRLYKENIINDTSINQNEKEKIFNDFQKNYQFIENGYLAYFFRLHQPAIIKMNDFKFSIKNANKESIIDRVLPTSIKVTVTYDGSSQVSYNYIWLLKLKKPFNKNNYPEKSYTCQVIYPNGSNQSWKINPK